MKTNLVCFSANLIRRLFTHMLLNILQIRVSIKELCSDSAKKVLYKYLLNIIRDLVKLHGVLLPEDNEQGSLYIDDYETEDKSL